MKAVLLRALSCSKGGCSCVWRSAARVSPRAVVAWQAAADAIDSRSRRSFLVNHHPISLQTNLPPTPQPTSIATTTTTTTSIHHPHYAALKMPHGLVGALLGMGNPLLDISAVVDQAFLDKYDVSGGMAGWREGGLALGWVGVGGRGLDDGRGGTSSELRLP